MKHFEWKASAFLSKTTSKPLQYCVVGILVAIIFTAIFCYIYKVDYRVVVEGEVVSEQGLREIAASVEGVIDLKRIEVGQLVNENEIIGHIKIPFANHEAVTELLVKMHKLYESVQNKKSLERLIWPDLNSENPFISEQLEKTKLAISDFNNEIESKIKISDLKITNLNIQKNKLVKRISILSVGKSRNLTESLVDDIKKDLDSINEEIAKIENENIRKTTEIKVQILSNLKNSYLKIHEFRESYIVKSYNAGVISKINITQNQFVKKDQIVVYLSAEKEEFRLKIRIPTFEAGKVSLGQKTKAEIDSFPYQKFGLFEGEIIGLDKIVTYSGEESYYNAYSTVNSPIHGKRLPAAQVQLLPGMKAKIHIVLKRVTIFELLYERLISKDAS